MDMMTSMLYIHRSIDMSHKAKMSRYFLELMGAMVLYAAAVVATVRVAPGIQPATLKALICIAPMIPIGLAIWAIARHFHRLDEYLKLSMLEDVAVAAAVTAGASLTYGFLENAGFPKLSMFVVWPVMGAVWFALACIRQCRVYRNR
jgi:hypothetical protein